MKRLSSYRLLILLALLGAAPSLYAEAAPARSSTLDTGWLFQPDPLRVGDSQHWENPDFDRSAWRSIAVPMAWDEYSPVMQGYEGVGWYALPLPADRVAANTWQRLRFGRANYHATVWIDGQKAGENLNGYLPFEIAASPYLTPGRAAWVVVRVENGARYDWLPGSTTVEWVQYGGLLEPVELLTTAPTHITHVSIRATPRGKGARVAVTVEVSNASDTAFAGRVRFETTGGKVDAEVRVGPRAVATVTLNLELKDAHPWSPETPTLYDARVILSSATAEVDAVTDRFGIRSIETKGRQILLNGRPLRIRGFNRYDEFPDHGPVVDAATIRADLEAVKATGANLVRIHYPQAPITLALADEIGLLYMEEVPLNWWRAAWHPKVPPEFENDRIIDAAEQALVEMVRRDGNHPSLIIWSVANECETADDLGVRAMERLLTRAKELDPSRLVTYVANRQFSKQRAFAKADLVAVNLYYGMWDGDVAENLGEIDARVYAPTRKALEEDLKLFPNKPILLSEFGVIGIPGSGGDVRFSEDYQAAYLSAVWRAVVEVPEICGAIAWCWADYHQRNGFTNDFPTYYGPFGVVGLERRPKKAQAALRALWTQAAPVR